MGQLGSGNNSGYPQSIDTRQLFANGTPAAPDDATRIDSELVNDALDAIVKIEHALGANPQGVYGSLAARLQQHMPGSGGVPPLFTFFEQSTWTIPGATHHLAAPALVVQTYDTSTPYQQIQPMRVTIDPSTYDIVVSWATAQSGSVVLGGGPPLYSLPFTAQTTLTIAGATHALGTPHFLVSVFSAETPAQLVSPASVVIDPATANVTVSFVTPQSGTVILCAMGPRHVEPFTAQTTLTVPGATHTLGSYALLLQLFDETGAYIEPNTLTVHPITFDVTATFLVAQSGTLLLTRAQTISGRDFLIVDGGIPASTAVQMYSEAGVLNLQAGSGEVIILRNRLGLALVGVNHIGHLGIGTTTPTHHLHLTTDDAAKLATSTWLILSDARLKDVLGPFEDGLDVLAQLDPVRFRYNGLGETLNDGVEHIGFLADAVEAVAPYMVRRRTGRLTPESAPTEILEFNGHAMTHILTNAVKELLDLNTALTARVDALEVTVATFQGAQP